MAKEPLEVDPVRPDQKLDCMSRVNFGKIYTVEHNINVLPVGKIMEASRARFLEYAQSELSNRNEAREVLWNWFKRGLLRCQSTWCMDVLRQVIVV
jgi:hypothetical protein